MKDLFNVPNTISLIRLALIPVFVWLVVNGEYGPAAVLLGIIGATDWIDGYLARRLGQVTELGKFLDPLADRIAVAVAVVAGLIYGVLPEVFAWLLITREVLVGIGAVYGWRHGVTRLDVRYIGKLATLLLYFAVSFFYAGKGFEVLPVSFTFAGEVFDTNLFTIAGYLTGMPGLVLYYWVAVQYLGDMRTAIAEVDPAKT
jgi:cardiolipin synthase